MGRYPRSLDSHLQALRIRKELFDDCHTATANSYLEISMTQFERGVYDSAFEELQNAVQIRTDLLAKQQEEITHCQSDEQQVKKLLSEDYESALQLYQRALTVTQQHSNLQSHNHLPKEGLAKLKKKLVTKANTYSDLGNEEILKIDRTELDQETDWTHVKKF
ncbi:hypothetical protein OS493_026366 [Desmophyllum pertusum]|uniref:Uncharacterized protein n=1 Tax=Desmophyllum pertusum TaxID=174260 RepID=A0A9W9ZCV8_9CNID|nr:hypothetical protein OS493_026366 [Desmophyllum pertusum]